MIVNNIHNTMLNNPVRQIKGKAELYNGSALSNTFLYTDKLKSFEVERVGEGKFFGYGICQKANLKLIDVERALEITTAHSFKLYLGVNDNYITPYPTFYVSEVHRDENTGELSITAYDGLGAAAAHTTEEITLESYTLGEYAEACATLLGISGTATVNVNDGVFELEYEAEANLEGTESIRDTLNAIAEASQTLYFLNNENVLIFKRLDRDGAEVYSISKERYITLESKTNRRLKAIISATELGDNLEASIEASGSIQYVRNNPFWELREDLPELLDLAIDAVGGLTINQFSCSWRGNYLVEIGDKLALTTKDGGVVYSFLLNDKSSYDGTYTQATEWSYEENDTETESNPNTLGEAISETFAKVDKVNKQIDIVVSETDANSSAISSIQSNTESINASVQSIEKALAESTEALNEDIATLTERVNLAITKDELEINIESVLEDGVNKVTTNTGFTFDDTGLTVSKSGSEMTTTITEDGMSVYKDGEEMLEANNKGVNAVNLRATTYLIIGTNSRLEDYEGNRTGCFWIGGN